MRNALRVAAILLWITAAVLLPACDRGGAAPVQLPKSPAAGVVIGAYTEHASDGSVGEPAQGVTIGLFTEPYAPGSMQYAPPKPIDRATTDTDGVFRFGGLEPGRYFVVPIDARAVVAGRWVSIASDRGATVRLSGCTDCPAQA